MCKLQRITHSTLNAQRNFLPHKSLCTGTGLAHISFVADYDHSALWCLCVCVFNTPFTANDLIINSDIRRRRPALCQGLRTSVDRDIVFTWSTRYLIVQSISLSTCSSSNRETATAKRPDKWVWMNGTTCALAAILWTIVRWFPQQIYKQYTIAEIVCTMFAMCCQRWTGENRECFGWHSKCDWCQRKLSGRIIDPVVKM